MAIEIIGREVNAAAACHIGGPVCTTLRKFIVDAPVLEAWLRTKVQYEDREVIGAVAPANGE